MIQPNIISITLLYQPKLRVEIAKGPLLVQENPGPALLQAFISSSPREPLRTWSFYPQSTCDMPQIPLLRALREETSYCDAPLSVFGPLSQVAVLTAAQPERKKQVPFLLGTHRSWDTALCSCVC